MLHVQIGVVRVVLCNIYGPNQDDTEFFEDILGSLTEFQGESPVIFGGDFNLPLDLDLDRFTRAQNPSRPHEQTRTLLSEWMEAFDVLDVWRMFNPQSHKFTWFTKSPCIYMSWIDYFLVSDTLFTKTVNAEILPGF